MRYLTQAQRLRRAERENEALRGALAQQGADLEYLAMMAGVDMEEESDDAQSEI